MSSDIAIEVKSLSKAYKIYEKPSHRLWQLMLGQKKSLFTEFQALQNINLEIKKGETLGIVGRNGSGKSTLLQIICGTLTPSEGDVITHGRIAALLELGSGFNPDFTGRENVLMNASILGISKQEIATKFDDIARFADIGEHLEQPVKTYSSGMMMRLAFAVAVSVDPQILVIDEALSVGDELFQRKCFARIQEIKENGATIIFVSHSAGAVVELCDRAALLNKGALLTLGEPKMVIGHYQRLIYAPESEHEALIAEITHQADNSEEQKTPESAEQIAAELPRAIKSTAESSAENHDFFDANLQSQSMLRYPSQGAEIEDIEIVGEQSQQKVNVLKNGNRYVLRYNARFSGNAGAVRAGTKLKTLNGVELGGIQSHPVGNGISYVSAGEIIQFEFPFDCHLLPGLYFFNTGVMAVVEGEETFLHRIVDAYPIRVAHETELNIDGIVDFRSCSGVRYTINQS